jgi:hypothetical protein
MTTGALIFAFDNESTDYVTMAQWSARNIRRWLNIPVAIVTNANPRDPRVSGFDHVITADAASGGTRWFEDYQATVTWHNASRIDAYSLTPWSRTLVLDADYVVASDQLKILLNSDQDFLAHARAYDITGVDNFTALNEYGEYHMPMSWATVMMFRRSTHAQLIFDCMKMIRDNWRHYKDLFRIVSSNFRNDYALSIALGIVNGQTLAYQPIPWSLASVTPQHTLTRTSKDCYRIDYQDQDQRARWTTIRNQDFHAMGKLHLEKIIETH